MKTLIAIVVCAALTYCAILSFASWLKDHAVAYEQRPVKSLEQLIPQPKEEQDDEE